VVDTATKTGKSARSISRDATRAKSLGDDLDRVAGTSLDKGSELDALAAMSPEQRAPLIERAVAGENVSAQAEGTFPVYFGSCHGGRVETERTSTKAKADRAAVKQPKPMPDVTAAADRAERVQPASQPRIDQFVNAKGEVKSACDFNPEDPDDVAEPGDSDEAIHHRIFLHHASEALRHARAVASLRQKASPQEITDDIIKAAWQAAKAWSELMEVLDPVRFDAARVTFTGSSR